ncbi:MAG TPA: SIS domain-containing protein [Candidatus Acidoferrales bacterium]|nr:SIS domain-containing protein [Candidatus Acidoferrales bacterium]
MASEGLRQFLQQNLRDGAEARAKLVDACLPQVVAAAQLIHKALSTGNKLLLFGNGGSAADAQHMAAEFVCRFAGDRQALPAVALTTNGSALTAIANDYGFEQVFARQIRALGRKRDVAIGISTSGRSRNVIGGIDAARRLGLRTIVLTGAKGARLASQAEIACIVPSAITAHIQEGHIAILHALCAATDAWLVK